MASLNDLGKVPMGRIKNPKKKKPKLIEEVFFLLEDVSLKRAFEKIRSAFKSKMIEQDVTGDFIFVRLKLKDKNYRVSLWPESFGDERFILVDESNEKEVVQTDDLNKLISKIKSLS